MLHQSVRHTPPNTTMMVKILCDGLQRHCAHEEKGCIDTNKVFDHLQEGMQRIQTEKGVMSEGVEKEGMNEVDDDHEHRVAVKLDDLEV